MKHYKFWIILGSVLTAVFITTLVWGIIDRGHDTTINIIFRWLVAIAPIVLAFAAFWTIMELRSSRREDLSTRGLENIIEWVESTQRSLRQLEADATMLDREQLKLALESIRAKSRGRVRIALVVGGENLKLLAEVLYNNIDEYLNGYNTINPNKLKEMEGEIRQNCNNLLEKAIAIQYR